MGQFVLHHNRRLSLDFKSAGQFDPEQKRCHMLSISLHKKKKIKIIFKKNLNNQCHVKQLCFICRSFKRTLNKF